MEKHAAVWIKDGHRLDGTAVDFIDMILSRYKHGETRSHNRLTLKPVGICRDGLVYGIVQFGKPYPITAASEEHELARIDGTEYGLDAGETKFYYPVTVLADFRSNPIPVAKTGNYATFYI